MAELSDPNLLQVLRYWSYWDSSPPLAVPRRLQLPESLDPELVLVVQGVRRCGKSTLLGQFLKRYQIESDRCAFINFEDPRLIPHLHTDLLFRLVSLFQKRHPEVSNLTFFFDEIQNVPQWESFLHAQLERPQHRFVVTGSNASLLSGELSSKLTGRHLVAELYPFDFVEAGQARSGLSARDYLTEGGFPKIVLSDGDLALRQQYFRDIVERDISNRVGARDSGPVLRVLQMAFESCGSEMSLRRIAAANGLSPETAGGYLQAAEDAYLLFACHYFTYSSRKQAVRNKKYYPVDPGLRLAVVSSSSPDLGKALENVVFLTLKKRYGKVFYWRDRGEVDFVVMLDGKPLPIQVTWEEPQPRHHESLDEFYQAHPRAHEGLFLTRRDLEREFRQLPRVGSTS
jgi:predicted AAA+ superfamily ATPase